LAPSRKTAGGTGVLYAYEIYDLSLPKAGLVVLAGCGTAAGELSAGEGVMSLARPFLARGVPAVVASLWSARDLPSKSLFLDFHRALLAGRSPAAALRLAQLRALNGTSPERRWPVDWAGFQVIGGS
jgi:CHAT domain-containing protein